MYFSADDDESEVDEIDAADMLREERAKRWHNAALDRHPDPRDPDHPE